MEAGRKGLGGKDRVGSLVEEVTKKLTARGMSVPEGEAKGRECLSP